MQITIDKCVVSIFTHGVLHNLMVGIGTYGCAHFQRQRTRSKAGLSFPPFSRKNFDCVISTLDNLVLAEEEVSPAPLPHHHDQCSLILGTAYIQ